MENPIKDLVPSLGPLSELAPTLMMFLSALWFIVILVCIGWLIVAIGGMAKARMDRDPDGNTRSAAGIAWPLGALVLLVSLPVIVGAITSAGA